jgi:hypothetical protein
VFCTVWTIFDRDDPTFVCLNSMGDISLQLILTQNNFDLSNSFFRRFSKTPLLFFFFFGEICKRVITNITLFREAVENRNKVLGTLISLQWSVQENPLARAAVFRLLIVALSPDIQNIAFGDLIFHVTVDSISF